MRCLRYLPAFALLLGALLTPIRAQTSFRLTAPTLFVDRMPTEVEHAVEAEALVEHLRLAVPGHGTYLIATEPFEGARRIGQFTEETLAFTIEGRTIWLVNEAPMLDQGTPAPAFVRFDPNADTHATGLAHLSAPSHETVTLPAQAFAARPHEVEASTTETAALNAEIGTLQRRLEQTTPGGEALEAERRRLAQEVTQLEMDRATATSQRALLADARDRLRAELDALQRDIEAYEEEVRQAEAERARLAAEREQRAARLTTARMEVEALDAAVSRLEGQYRRLTAERARLTAEQRRLQDESQILEELVPTLATETPQLRARRDRLLQERDSLRHAQARLTQEVGGLQETIDVVAAETQRLEQERTVALTDQRRLEDGRLAQARERHAADAAPSGEFADPLDAQSPASAAPSTLTIALPGFDLDRLRNSDEVQTLLARTEYPAGALGSDTEHHVIVLFATNEAGDVVEANVEEPQERALDPLHALAVALVRRMAFIPREMNGQPAALYARVLVRFARSQPRLGAGGRVDTHS
ncbi:MAG: hypothetical protein HKN04_08265 [Rhodothermaceae bacterium]|nr:hypothetical protein [Rhodothermaceae bacterium]